MYYWAELMYPDDLFKTGIAVFSECEYKAQYHEHISKYMINLRAIRVDNVYDAILQATAKAKQKNIPIEFYLAVN